MIRAPLLHLALTLMMFGGLGVIGADSAQAQADVEQPPPAHNTGRAPTPYTPAVESTSGRIIFWIGGFGLMALVGFFVFREQVGERKTIRLMSDRISPFFREFDPRSIQRWVEMGAPHVWHGWRSRDLSQFEEFATPEFLTEQQALFEEARRKGLTHEARLGSVLKVHPLSLHMIGEGPAPADVELILRVEEKAIDCVRDPAGQIVSGKPDVRQLAHFWTLRHDGHRWRLHHVEAATRERRDLGRLPPVPPISAWRRPESP